jgi:hypothetical protein
MGIRNRNCCPSYFFNQNNVTSIILQPNTPVDVITVTVTTNLPGERVRIDSMVETTVITTAIGGIYGYNVSYNLFRDNVFLANVSFVETQQVKQIESAVIVGSTNITWTDVPPGPGTFTYRLEGIRVSAVEENIERIQILDRSIDAIVFPPVNP